MSRTAAWLTDRLTALERAGDYLAREELIFEGIRDPDPALREVAVAWAARCVEPGRLLAIVADPADFTGRSGALSALERQGPYAEESVAQLTADPDPDQAMFACQVLGMIGGEPSVEPLLDALAHPEVNVVQAAAEALGRLKSPRAVKPLLALLDREAWLQLAALDALGAIGDASAVPGILELVPDSFVAEPALKAVARIGSPEIIEPMVKLLTSSNHGHLRPLALLALGGALEAMNPLPDLPVLRTLLADETDPTGLGEFLHKALEERGDERSGADDRRRGRGGSLMTRAAAGVGLAAGPVSLFPAILGWAADRDGANWVLPLAARAPRLMDAAHALLDEPNSVVRAALVRAAPAGTLTLEQLVPLLEDTGPLVRQAVASAMASMNDPQAVPILARGLAWERPAERIAAARALSRFPASVLVPELASRLAEGTPAPELVATLSVLAQVACPELEEVILHYCAHRVPEIRSAAMAAAATLPGPRAERVLFRGLADRDPKVQVEVLSLLMRRGGQRVVATLRALLEVNDSFRYHVIRALGRLAATEAAAPLEALFPTVPLHEQLEIVAALGRIGNEASLSFLRECLEHPEPELRRVAAQGLVAGPQPADETLLRQLAGDHDWFLRSEAARGLGRLPPETARPALLELARDLEPAVARAARAALAATP